MPSHAPTASMCSTAPQHGHQHDAPIDAIAMTLVEPQRFEPRAVRIEPPDAEQVLVAVRGCGVCASNVPPWEARDWFTYPMQPGGPGHEAWGTVHTVGEHITHVAVGDDVAMMSQQAYASHVRAEANDVVKLTDSLRGQDFPGEPIACAMNIFERSGVEAGDEVLILGVGFLGALLVQLCQQAGARVVASSRRACGLQWAERFGAAEAWDDQALQASASRFGGFFDAGRFDVVIEATGKAGPLDLVGKLVRQRGRLVIAGFHQDGPRQIDMQLWNWRGLDVINAHERDPRRYRDGLRRAITAVSDGVLDIRPCITHRLPMRSLNEAMQLTIDRPAGFLKAVVTNDHHNAGGMR